MVDERVRRNRRRVAFETLCGFCLLALLAPQSGAQEKSFLWKVGSAENSIHILGSIHFLKRENYPLKKSIEEAFAGAKKVVLEIDLKAVTGERAQQVMLDKALYRDGTTLRQNIAAETYSSAEQRAHSLGIDLRAMSPFKPWFAALTMTSLKLQKLGFDSNYGVDRYLAERAKESDKATGGLETLEFQIGLMDQLSRRDQEMMLREALRELDLLDKGVERIVRSWLAGDVKALDEVLLAGMREYPEVHQKLIVERNRRWVPQIDQMIRQGENVLVVVGAAHLVGKDGIIELLRARGYSVEQM
jgi:uncharacterized protein YbaP (TraB family)